MYCIISPVENSDSIVLLVFPIRTTTDDAYNSSIFGMDAIRMDMSFLLNFRMTSSIIMDCFDILPQMEYLFSTGVVNLLGRR